MSHQILFDVFRFQRAYLSMLVDDIPDERMTQQPGGVSNHPAWQIGHLAGTLDNACAMMGGTKTLEESWGMRYGMGSKPTAERGAYPSRAELLKVLDDRRAAFTLLLERAPAERLNAPNPVARVVDRMPTVGHMVRFLMLSHESMHLGQLASWRKAAGMPEALSKLGG